MCPDCGYSEHAGWQHTPAFACCIGEHKVGNWTPLSALAYALQAPLDIHHLGGILGIVRRGNRGIAAAYVA